jgi:hypothetical protein
MRASTAALAVAVLAALAAACTPPSEPDPYLLRPALGDGAIQLTWQAPGGEPASSYVVQWRTDELDWSTFEDTAATAATFTEVTDRTRYTFRVRAQDSTTWSRSVPVWYVDLQLPVLRIDTVGDAPILDRENYVPGTVTLEPNGSAFEPYTGTIGIRGRGNSTWTYSKKPYKMKLDKKSELMGLGEERDWALLANAVDESQLRTYAAMQASEMTDLPYTPAVRHIEIVLNGQYQGVYVLTEHQEPGEDRVDITEMEDTDNTGVEVTGGYRLEIDDRLEENQEQGWRTARGVPVVIKDPETTPQQWAYITNYVQAFETALFSPNFTDPVNGYRRYLDVDSFIDHYLVQEITKNQDVFWSSTFFTKERGDDLLRFGPVWDFDRSMGSLKGVVDLGPEGFRARGRGPWSNRIFQDPTFVAQVAERWQELRPAFATLPDLIMAKGAELSSAIQSDLPVWHYPGTPALDTTDTPEFLADWMLARMAWLDTQYPPPAA